MNENQLDVSVFERKTYKTHFILFLKQFCIDAFQNAKHLRMINWFGLDKRHQVRFPVDVTSHILIQL